MNYLPTCTSTLVVQHLYQVSFKSMEGCRSWEDKLKCVIILSFKGHNSAKICRTWIISPHALLHSWYNICTKFHSNPCKDVGVEKTNFDMTEGRTKQTLNAPLPFYGGGIIKRAHFHILVSVTLIMTSCLNTNTSSLEWKLQIFILGASQKGGGCLGYI